MNARSARSLAAEAKFCARLVELGATPLYERWLGTGSPHRVRCAAGHDCWPRPANTLRGNDVCRTCARRMAARSARSLAAEAAFLARLGELGATPLETEWLGIVKPHRVRCAAGHECRPRPHDVLNGDGICRTCVRRNPVTAEAAFRARLAELGATPLYEEYLGCGKPHHVRCAEGHDCWPRPNGVQQGEGICRPCGYRNRARRTDSTAAEAAFRQQLGELAAELLEPYKNRHAAHHVRCAAGHDCYPRPGDVRRGVGICRACAGLDPVQAEANFRARLAELGATPLYDEWLGAMKPHRVRCAAGHDCRPYPNNVQQGSHVCRICARCPQPTAEAAFRARLAELGAELLEPYKNANRGHHVRCKAGHDCWPRPAQLRDGGGVCRTCAGKVWDVFYVVTHNDEPRVKFGISNLGGRPRLLRHRAAGYRTVVRLLTSLPDGAALNTERAVKSALAMAGEKPIHGREYFDASCLSLILDVADSWLSSPPAIKAEAIAYVQEALF